MLFYHALSCEGHGHRNPIGHEQSAVDGAISVLEIYGLLSSHTRSRIMDNALELATSYGVGWANSGGEAMRSVRTTP